MQNRSSNMNIENYKWHSINNTCSIFIEGNEFVIEGEYYIVKNREIVKSDKSKKILDINNFVGASNLRIKSERKLNNILFAYIIISIIKVIINFISDLIGRANDIKTVYNGQFLELILEKIKSFILSFLPFPTSLDIFAILLVVSQLIILVVFFIYVNSKKDVYEFTFTSSRIAIDKKILNEYEFIKILNEIKKRRN